MSDWRDFLDDLAEPAGTSPAKPKPGPVMICFVNRYLQALDGIHYKIKHGNQLLEGRTSEGRYCITIQPYDLNPVQVYAWSRERNAFKRLDDVRPAEGRKRLVRKIMKTYKVDGKTEPHPRGTPIAPPPAQPKPAPAPAPSPTTDQGTKPSPAKDESGLPITDVERPVPDKITKEQLKKIFVKAKEDYLQQIADELNKDLAKFKLDTPIRRAHFFGQVRQESGPGARGDAESMNYTPNGLLNTFSRYYGKHPDEARQDGRQDLPHKRAPALSLEQQRVIANKGYGELGVGPSLGNVAGTDDGWNYRGRGLKQTTGRRNYRDFRIDHEKYWGEKIDFITHPDFVAQFPYSVRAAVAFWLKNDCWKAADKGMNDAAIDAVTKIVNSGEINKHKAGKYKPQENPVLHRRTYVYLAYAAFT